MCEVKVARVGDQDPDCSRQAIEMCALNTTRSLIGWNCGRSLLHVNKRTTALAANTNTRGGVRYKWGRRGRSHDMLFNIQKSDSA